MANFETLQPAGQMNLRANSNNNIGPLSPYVSKQSEGRTTPKRLVLQSLNGNSPGQHLFKMRKSVLQPRFILSPAKEAFDTTLNSSIGTEYGFGDLQSPTRSNDNSRRNSLDDDVCIELTNTPQSKTMRVIEENVSEDEDDEEEIVDHQWVARGTVTHDGVDMVRTKANQVAISNVHAVNTEQRGQFAGVKTKYNLDSAEMTRQAQVPKQMLVNDQFRGADVGVATKVTSDSMHIAHEINTQVTVANYRRVNEQVRLENGSVSIPADSVEMVRTHFNQTNVANVRMVNGEVRGTEAGKKTLYGTDSKQLSAEIGAQDVIADCTRVSNEARGQTAGNKTLYSSNARDVVHNTHQQTSFASHVRVNQQIAATGAGTIPSDSVENTRAKEGQDMVSDIRLVNEQVRGGALAGAKHAYGIESRQMSREITAQQSTNANSRVNEQARGELAGRKSLIDRTSKQFVLAREAPKSALVNNQITKVDAGVIPIDSFEMRHMKSKQTSQALERNIRASMTGKSQFGAMATEVTRIANVPKTNFVNNQIRGANSGPSSYNTQATEYIRVTNAPKLALVSKFTGSVRRDGKADASFFSKTAPEWRPESELIQVEVAAPVVEETPKEIEPVDVEPQWSDSYNLFQLSAAPKNLTLARKKKAAEVRKAQETSADFDDAPSSTKFGQMLSRFR